MGRAFRIPLPLHHARDFADNTEALRKPIQELKGEYSMTVEPARRLRAEVQRIERRLSDLVNQAYGFTTAEVELLCRSAPPRMLFMAHGYMSPDDRDGLMSASDACRRRTEIGRLITTLGRHRWMACRQIKGPADTRSHEPAILRRWLPHRVRAPLDSGIAYRDHRRGR